MADQPWFDGDSCESRELSIVTGRSRSSGTVLLIWFKNAGMARRDPGRSDRVFRLPEATSRAAYGLVVP